MMIYYKEMGKDGVMASYNLSAGVPNSGHFVIIAGIEYKIDKVTWDWDNSRVLVGIIKQ